MLKNRFISAVCILSALAAYMLWANSWVILLLLLFLSYVGSREYLRLAYGDDAVWPLFGQAIGLLWLVGHFFYLREGFSFDYLWITLPLIFLLSLALTLRRDDPQEGYENLKHSMLGMLYVPFCIQYLMLLLFGLGGDGRWLVLYVILIVKGSDIGAYFAGKYFGKHKLIAHISPGKTIEGAVGGVVAGCLIAVGGFFITQGDFQVTALSVESVLIFATLLIIVGIMGDLFESLLKRAAGVKDSGTSIKGMGGALDVLDSLLLAFPVAYVFVKLVG